MLMMFASVIGRALATILSNTRAFVTRSPGYLIKVWNWKRRCKASPVFRLATVNSDSFWINYALRRAFSFCSSRIQLSISARSLGFGIVFEALSKSQISVISKAWATSLMIYPSASKFSLATSIHEMALSKARAFFSTSNVLGPGSSLEIFIVGMESACLFWEVFRFLFLSKVGVGWSTFDPD